MCVRRLETLRHIWYSIVGSLVQAKSIFNNGLNLHVLRVLRQGYTYYRRGRSALLRSGLFVFYTHG